ncbi:MAG: 30S ribosomal protein S6--L-glutamate ligase [Crocinitomicaceae bacterium]
MRIVILSRNPNLYSTSRLKEAGEQRGHEMLIVDHTRCDIVIEKKKPMIIYKGKPLTNVDAVIPRIGASVTFYGASVIRQFEMMKVFTSLESQALTRSRDKLRSLQILSRAGLNMPKTAFTNFSKSSSKILDQIGPAPYVIKLLEGTQGVGVVLTETRSAAESVLEAFQGLQARVIVQEFIEEAKGADIRAFVVGGQVVGAMKRQAKEGEFRSNLHRGGSAEIIQLSEDEEKAALKAARVLKLGIAGVDMLQSKSGPMIMEVNSSPGLEGIEASTGKDIARSIIRFVEDYVDE